MPLAREMEAALRSEDRAATQAATERLVAGLTSALRMPPVEVEVLAARPHSRWGELHGLYTADGKRPPRIQVWMRTARQRRVVAFRTYLRTLLHEVGHHIDYSLLRLKDSFHTEGFYKRESSLFHQLVTEDRATMATLEEYAALPLPRRLARLERTAEELTAAIAGRGDSILSRRPDGKNWSAKEVVCHLRDIEEVFLGRFQQLMAMDEPTFLPVEPDRWAEERQYARNEGQAALAAFQHRREETLAFLRALPPAAWQRGGIHPSRGRMGAGDLVTLLAWHDDNHLDQLRRALDGRA